MNIDEFVNYAVLVALISLRPLNSASVEPWDNALHVVLYGIFAVLGYRVIKGNRAYFYICLGIIAYSGLIEVALSFMPGRVMSAYDLIANTTGVVLGAVIVKMAAVYKENT